MKKRILSLVALLGFFKGDFYEVSVDYIKTLFLGVRRSVVRVLALVVLLACCVSPAYAEFGSTDSNNLSSIRTNVQNIWNRLNTNFDYRLSSLASLISTANSTLSAINTNLLNTVGWNLGKVNENLGILYDKTEEVRSLLDSISSKVDTLIQNQETQIQNQETQISNQETQIQNQETQIENENQIIDNQDRLYDFLYQPKYGFLEENFSLSTRYFNFSNYTSTYPYGSFTDTPKSSDLPFFQSFDGLVYAINFGAQPFSTGQIDTPVLVEGREYIVSFSFPADSGVELHHFSFNSMVQSISNLSYRTNFVANFGYLTTISFSFESPATTPILLFSFYMDNGSPISLVSGGYLMVSISPVSDQQFLDDSFGGSVNSGQSQITNDVQSSVGQLDDFDNEIFQNVSDYTAQLDFGLSSWADAAAGISYIGSIFLMVWNNSPTQVVVLSLMIGLCILLLGRGARVAGAIRRSHRDDDGGGG